MAIVFFAPVLVGSAHEWVMAVESLLCILLLLVTLVPVRSGWDKVFTVPHLTAILVAWAVLSLAQLLPLFTTPFHDPSSAAISLDPPATVFIALRLLGLGAMVLASAVACRRDGPGVTRKLLWAVALAGAIGVVSGVVGFVFDSRAILAFYEPEVLPRERGLLTGTFVNPTHQAQFFGMGLVAALALALSRHERPRRVVAVALATVCGAGLVTMLNVEAVVATGIAAIAVLLAVGAMRRRAGARGVSFAAGAVAAFLLAVAVSFLIRTTAYQGPSISGQTWSRMAVLKDALRMVKTFALFGSGGGSFGTVFPAFNTAAPELVFDHLWCQPVQVLAEWGVVFGGLILILGTLAFVRLARCSLSDTASIGAFAVVMLVFLMAFVDFGIQTNGIAIPAAALLGCMGGTMAKDGLQLPGISVRRAPLFALSAFGLVLAMVLAARPEGPSLKDDWKELRARQTDISLDQVIEAKARHPGSYLPPLVAGTLLSLRGEHEAALTLLLRAAALNPGSYVVRLAQLRAMLLAKQYEEARGVWATLRAEKPVATLLFDLFGQKDLRPSLPMLLLGKGVQQAEVREFANFFLGAGRPDLAMLTYRRAALADPKEPLYRAWLGRLALDSGDIEAAEREAVYLLAHHPDAPEGHDLMGMVLRARGMFVEAAHMHLEAAKEVPDDPEPLIRAAQALFEASNQSDAEAVLMQAATLCKGNDCGLRVAVLRSQVLEAQGLLSQAIAAQEEAERFRPDDIEVLLRLADLFGKVGDVSAETTTLKRILARYPSEPRAQSRIQGLGKGPETTPGPARTTRQSVW